MEPPERQTLGKADEGRKALALTGLLGLQAVASGFFVLDVAADVAGLDSLTDGFAHVALELAAVIVLIVSMVLTYREIQRVKRRQSRMEAQLRIARGAFAELLDEHFDAWGLTPSERDVALLAIKGLSIAEIADVRQTKDGTIKAQCNAIYSKAGVTGRPQLLSLFIEELLAERLV